jgi:surface protein
MERAERLDRMFQNAELFDGDLSTWKMTSRSIGSMFFGARSFTGSRGLVNWDTSGINDMHAVFYQSKFQGDISSWNLGSTTTTRQMFEGCANFDGNISTWDVSKVR